MQTRAQLGLALIAAVAAAGRARVATAGNPVPAGVTVEGRVLEESERRGATGPSQDVVVILEPLRVQAAAAAAPEPRGARLREALLSFNPRVQVATPGSTLVVENADTEVHTIHGQLGPGGRFNFASPPAGKEVAIPLREPGVLALTCDVHDFMQAWVVVTSDPAAVSGRDGRFRLARVPAGRYRLRAWEPHRNPTSAGGALGTVLREIEIPADGRAIEIVLPPDPTPARSPAPDAHEPPPPTGPRSTHDRR